MEDETAEAEELESEESEGEEGEEEGAESEESEASEFEEESEESESGEEGEEGEGEGESEVDPSSPRGQVVAAALSWHKDNLSDPGHLIVIDDGDPEHQYKADIGRFFNEAGVTQIGDAQWRKLRFENGQPFIGQKNQAGDPVGTSWCGIWASWIWAQVLPGRVKWIGGAGIHVDGSRNFVQGPLGDVQPGDVIVMNPETNHHAVVVAVCPQDDGSVAFATMNGNMGAVYPEGTIVAKMHALRGTADTNAGGLDYHATNGDQIYGYYPFPG